MSLAFAQPFAKEGPPPWLAVDWCAFDESCKLCPWLASVVIQLPGLIEEGNDLAKFVEVLRERSAYLSGSRKLEIVSQLFRLISAF